MSGKKGPSFRPQSYVSWAVSTGSHKSLNHHVGATVTSRTFAVLLTGFVALYASDANSQALSAQGNTGSPEHQRLTQKIIQLETELGAMRQDLAVLLRIVGGSCNGSNSFVKAVGTDGSIVCGSVDFPAPSASAASGGGGASSSGPSAASYSPPPESADSSAPASADGGASGGAVMTYAISGGYFDDMNRWVDTYTPVVLGEGPVTSCVHCDVYVDNGAGATVHPWEAFDRWAAEQWAAVGVYGIY